MATTTALGSYLTTATAASTYLTPGTASSTYLPLAGGTLTGNLNFSSGSIYTNEIASETDCNFVVQTYDSTPGTYYNHTFNNADGRLILPTNGGGLTFPDSTTQTTAGIPDAPSDGDEYVRLDGAWAIATGGGGGGLSISDLSNAATSTLNVGVPTSGQALTYDGTDLIWATVGGGSCLPLAGGTMTGAIVFDGTSGQYISKGNFDTSRGGNYGISLVCSIGYEFNWQAGWLTTTEQNSVTPRPLYLDSLAGTTLRVWDSATSSGTEVSHENIVISSDATYDIELAGWGLGVQQSADHTKGTTIEYNGLHAYDGADHIYINPTTGITFADATSQTTAYADAPSDGKAYSRKDAGWVTDRINAYDNSVIYALGDQVVYSNVIYEMTQVAGVAGYDPVTYISNWTGISGPAGAAGANGANGASGAMNYLDIVTMTSSANPAYYESGGTWSVYYGFMNTSAGWFYNKLNASGVDFKLYINGVYDSTDNAAYNYYYSSGTLVGSPASGDVVTIFLSDGAAEATIPLVTYTY